MATPMTSTTAFAPRFAGARSRRVVARRARAIPRAAVSEPPAAPASSVAPAWTLPRDPLGPGQPPAAGTWGPTNQTINDWRSIYRNTSLSTTDGSAPRAISKDLSLIHI